MSHVNTCFHESPINNDTTSDYEDADSIGRGDTLYDVSRDTAYAVMLISRSESNEGKAIIPQLATPLTKRMQAASG